MISQFRQFLLQHGSVHLKYVPFHVKWVSDCYAFLGEVPAVTLDAGRKRQSLSHPSKTHPDWQVRQAEASLRLYDYFLSLENGQVPAAKGTSSESRTLEESMRRALRLRHRSHSTEKTYISWVRSFGSFAKRKQPEELTRDDLQDFLSYLAVEKKVSPSTQNQALNAIFFLFRHVLGKEIEDLDAVRARPRKRLPVVLTVKEVQRTFGYMSGVHRLMAMLVYGCGLRLQGCLSLRIKDIDLEQNTSFRKRR